MVIAIVDSFLTSTPLLFSFAIEIEISDNAITVNKLSTFAISFNHMVIKLKTSKVWRLNCILLSKIRNLNVSHNIKNIQ